LLSKKKRHPGEGRDLVDEKSLVSAPHLRQPDCMAGGWVYIMTNKPGGVLYIGVAADIVTRVAQHRAGEGSSFCRRYNLRRLVLAEQYPTIDEAIAREKALKEWQRAWKVRLIEENNPEWTDLWEVING
jgi:putative endonuclease